MKLASRERFIAYNSDNKEMTFTIPWFNYASETKGIRPGEILEKGIEVI